MVRLLVVFSDGESESPGDALRAHEAEKAALQAGTAVFPVILNKPGASTAFDSLQSIGDFSRLGEATGGKSLQGTIGSDVLPVVLKGLARELRNEYVAGYYLDSKSPHNARVALKPGVRGKLFGGGRVF